MGRLYIFFFQAEDGIRDIGVTGVQTCALPIFQRSEPAPAISEVAPQAIEVMAIRFATSGRLEDRSRAMSIRKGARVVPLQEDRKSVVQGKSADLGGRRIIIQIRPSPSPSPCSS